MQKDPLWIWEDPHYPKFVYDREKILDQLQSISKKQGELEGSIKFLSSEAKHALFRENLLDEIIYNASIEGEILQRSSVKASIRKQFENLQDVESDKHTDNIVSIQKDIATNPAPLTIERLNYWHYEIIVNSEYDRAQVDPGVLRDYDDMYVISGEGVRRRVHYLAPPAKMLKGHIETFLNYCNNTKENPLIKSAVAHIWFVQIHPYGDGNGRLTRNITNHLLAKEMGLDTRYFSISQAINKEIKTYGKILEETNRLTSNPKMDLTQWITWHNRMVQSAIEFSISVIDKSILKTKFYDRIRDVKMNANQSKAINMLLNGKEKTINNSIYRMITGTSQVTASRQLNDLVKKGILRHKKGGRGRSTSYELSV